ncbi:SurA N-terminal domain-containing protein [Stutzerimonas nitrititolerans]|uniref:Periplasmic chaperone PpiD n=1 Tax=Stutzerimonas nitrititolerans TaxID=2482751 RepID=A0ABX9VAZ2_9GAMM|nr:SurA N-terminal domain-containing protein [Stutzerimonas nitrititolerans]AFN78119.1 PpiC-type peptidyl-prolyl cis-trans isomerase [Stutzerimonas stutzeri DSM 10701]SUD84441.1 PpiC-type peptidyl-prolyl cis-trans isomerase [Stutzerimonas stutzeri]MBT1119463.1 SurA N-terminal domain-containing protein [Stutzerimonas nitrititolerans]NNT93003.1 peptidylprolyl isomerase [Stutzerimonas nitrititolerans]RMI02243.1 peptidylprolyl isomerase [Stutzerimonas nitrititolerans]
MLQNIRDNSQGWIAKTIIGIIVVLLALTGFEAIFNSSGNARNAAEVNGEEISLDELNQAVNMQRRQLMQQLGSDFDASLFDDKLMRDSALGALIDRTLLLQGARDADFAFSQAALDQLILQTPEFAVDGVFNAARFDQVIQQMGYTRMQFRQLLEQEMLIGQLRAGISGSGFVTDQQIERFAQLERQTRDFASITVAADSSAVQVSDEEARQYYEANTERFRSPEQVVLEYVELNKEAYFDEVDASEEELQELYRQQIGNLAEQRRAAHILIEVDGTSDAEAKAQLEEIAAQLAAGGDFATLAKEHSDDPGSANEGGDLGYAGPGVYDPAFEDALYALKEGQVSAPVRSEFGWHLIKLLGVQSPEVPSFESMKPELERELKAQQVEQRFVEVTKELENLAFESADLEQPAQELGLTVKTTEPFGREGGEGIAANRQVIQAAFSDEVLMDRANSSVIELDPDTVVAVRIKQHLEPEVQAFETVRDGIFEQLQHSKAAEQARSEGEKLLATLREGGEVEGQWQSVEAATRGQDGVAPAVLQTVFRMPKPEGESSTFSGVTLASGDYVVIRLNGVSEPDGELSAEEKQNYRRFLASRSGQQDFAAYREKQHAEAKIERL